jgi:NitT/TauT family transport system substrate-binding protein
MTGRNKLWFGATLMALTLVSSVCSAQPVEKFVYGVPSAVNTDIANFIFAEELGYFKEARISMEYIPVAGSGVSIPMMMSGQLQVTNASLEPLTISRVPGKQNFPLMFVYNHVRNSSWEFVVLDSSPIKTVADMKGKTIGVVAMSSGNVFMTRAVLKAEGILDQTTLQPVGFGVQAFEALRNKQVDVLNLWATMHAMLGRTATKIRRVEYPKAFQNLSSHGFLFSKKMIEENPGAIARFGRAVTKGVVACQAAPENCLRAFFRRYPNLRPSTAKTEEEAIRQEMPVLIARLGNIGIANPADQKKYGEYQDRDWQVLIDALKLGGEIPNDAKIPYDSLYTNRFVKDYNDFNIDEVVQQAKAYR